MPIQVQASDVLNPDPWIDPGMKQLWTFYGVDGVYRNHYGLLKVMGYDDKPTETFRPVLALYKGKIYPVNRIHSAWPGIETPGKPGLMQPRPPDIVAMWKAHLADTNKYPELARITDDNDDGHIEINRPDEIEALIVATTRHLKSLGYDLEGKRVVWVSNDRVYISGTQYRVLEKHEWEATPYANVHKYNHDVAPALTALGSGGCTDCHSYKSRFFGQPVLLAQFSPEAAQPVWAPNYVLLGYSAGSVWLGAFREATLKPILYTLLALLVGLLIILGVRNVAVRHGVVTQQTAIALSWVVLACMIVGGIVVVRTPDLAEYMTARRFALDAGHFWIGMGVLLVGLVLALQQPAKNRPGATPACLRMCLGVLLIFTGACGALMLLKLGFLAAPTRLAYTGFDLGLTLVALVSVIALLLRLGKPIGTVAGAEQSQPATA